MFDAAVSSHSSLAPSSSQPRFHFTPPFNNHSAATLNLPITHLKRCRIRIVSSINPTTNNYTNFQAVLPDKFPEASLSTPDSSPSLPRPLSSSIASNSDGSRLRVAYQGVSGAYSELAAETAYPNCEAVPCDQFDTAFEAVERWLVDRAVLPIENSLGGSIHRNYDLLLRHRLHIVGEVKLPIRHCLLANPGVKIDDLKRVLSHPQALAQCEHTLAKFGVTREAVDDTAGAAKFVAYNELKDAGAVASAAAARIYGLNILAEDIQDDSDNVTRFLMLAREPIIPGSDRPFKTSIVFSLVEGPGALFKALAVFALRHINLEKIESRPLRNSNNGSSKCFDYIFYLDFEASMADSNAQNALRHLEEFATLLRVLGSYPADTRRR
ncbi:arogenate dehydratase 2 [Beta vulgaris subsp. vulgaris]|uniref:arogenate dehydratase 2 n=1 Tax=Beta vulgaris subsp. vulgaris TaxID=3555 RepID=UPI002036D8A2|nr:arogenate dehydratase 2 [Beta vulgaris subsp. vulgaris]